MDWWSPENIIAAVGALLGLVAPIVGAGYQLRTRRGKRIGHRVQMDTTIGSGDGGKHQSKTQRGIFAVQPSISNPTLVLLRIENNGTTSIAETDYTNPDKNHGLTVVFRGRTVENFEVIPDPKATHLLNHFASVDGHERIRHNDNVIHLPRVPLNKGRHFKLLVLLSGGNVGSDVDVTGDIRDGDVKPTRSMSVDDKAPLFSRLALGTVIVLTLSIFTLAGTIVFRHPARPIGCATGTVKVVGSTAFAPAMQQLGGPDLPIRLVSRDANSGTRDLLRRRILGGQGEPAFTSRDCENNDSPQDEIIRCELGSTDEVLTTVARVPGAIGYSELRAAATATGLHTLNIDGQAPSVKAIGDDTYRFTEIEYAYTNGTPAADSLTASFLNYMIRSSGQDLLKAYGHLPCYTPEGLKRCQP